MAPAMAHLQVVVPLAPPRRVLSARRLQRVHQCALHGVMPAPLLIAARQYAVAQLAQWLHRFSLAVCVAVRSVICGRVLAVRLAGARRTAMVPGGWAVGMGSSLQSQGEQRLQGRRGGIDAVGGGGGSGGDNCVGLLDGRLPGCPICATSLGLEQKPAFARALTWAVSRSFPRSQNARGGVQRLRGSRPGLPTCSGQLA